MRLKISSLPLLLLMLGLATGCTTTVTNLTPGTQVRNERGLYHFEVDWDTTDATIRTETIQPFVIIGLEAFPLEPTPLLKNRWETLIPIPHNQNYVNYRYKFDYKYNAIPEPRAGSKLSTPYQLHIVEKND